MRPGDEEAVYAVDGFLESYVGRPFADWRNKTSLRLKRAAATPAEPRRFIALAGPEAARWEGYYRATDRDEVIRIDNIRGALQFKGAPVAAVHPDTLYLGNQTWLVRAAHGLHWVRLGTSEPLARTAGPDSRPEQLRTYAGEYWSEDAGATFRIDVKDAQLQVYRKPGDRFTLEPLFKDGFRSPDRAVFEFTRDPRGRVNGFLVSQQRARNVPFRRVAQPAGRP